MLITVICRPPLPECIESEYIGTLFDEQTYTVEQTSGSIAGEECHTELYDYPSEDIDGKLCFIYCLESLACFTLVRICADRARNKSAK